MTYTDKGPHTLTLKSDGKASKCGRKLKTHNVGFKSSYCEDYCTTKTKVKIGGKNVYKLL